MTLNKEKFINDIGIQGYSIIENVLDRGCIKKIKQELEIAIEKENEYHNEKNHKDYGMVMLCSLYGGSFIEIFNNSKVMEPFNSVLGDGCIIYAYTSSSMPPNSTNYSCRLHVDCPRIIPGYVTNMGATILLDDFTEENGATWFLPGSHLLTGEPSEDYFFKNAKKLVAKAGTGWFFNARIWHMGGKNNTDKWRHALTFNVCKPWMKQRIDIPRAMAHMDTSEYSIQALQKLGFFAQIPASYNEYYVPEEKRKFKQKVE